MMLMPVSPARHAATAISMMARRSAYYAMLIIAFSFDAQLRLSPRHTRSATPLPPPLYKDITLAP
jgi:hypothetical protein